jgi:hypothetical protein
VELAGIEPATSLLAKSGGDRSLQGIAAAGHVRSSGSDPRRMREYRAHPMLFGGGGTATGPPRPIVIS